MSRFGKGSRPSPKDDRDWDLHKICATRVALPDAVNHDNLVGFATDQSITSSCVGQACARAWYTRALLQGDAHVKYPSPFDVYAKARAAEAGDPAAPLLDNGTYPRLGLKAMAALGVVPMERWNDVGQINDRPGWDLLREATDARGVRFARVVGSVEMRLALAAGHPLVVAFDVDQSFEDYRGGLWNGMRGRALGGHATCIIGYDSTSKPVGTFTGLRFRGVNSWSESWGERGMYWISDLALLGGETWAVELVEAPGEGNS